MSLYKKRFNEYVGTEIIRPSQHRFKIQLFLERAENSLLIAKEQKEREDTVVTRVQRNYWTITIAYYAMLYAAKAAILDKGYEVKSHDAARIALGHLLIPNELEKEDLELLNQAHKIFEDQYVKYFEDAMTESHTARYQARPSYSERQVNNIFEKARKFIAKINLLLGT